MVSLAILNSIWRPNKQLTTAIKSSANLVLAGWAKFFLVEDNQQDDCRLALKKISAAHSQQSQLKEFLKLEFATLSKFKHPGLAQVFDFGVSDSDGSLFFTSEFVEGSDLKTFFAREPSADLLIAVTVQVARALAYIHNRGFLHLDLKPSNILINKKNTTVDVTLVDFGAARSQHLPRPKQLAGTPKYLAPEVLNGDTFDHTADLYSLGITLHDLHKRFLSADQSESSLAITKLISRLTNYIPYRRLQNANAVIHFINSATESRHEIETEAIRNDYIHCSDLVAREHEWVTLQAGFSHLLNAKSGRRRACTCLIRGESGVGKSRLARELRYDFQSRGITWQQATCNSDLLAFTSLVQQTFSKLGLNHTIVKRYLRLLAPLLPDFNVIDADSQVVELDIAERVLRFLVM